MSVCVCVSVYVCVSMCVCVQVLALPLKMPKTKILIYELQWQNQNMRCSFITRLNLIRSVLMRAVRCDAGSDKRAGARVGLLRCRLVLLSSFFRVRVCVCECGPGLVSAGPAAVILGRCPGGGRFGLSSWRCRVRIRQPPNVRKATRVRFMINMRYNTKYTINKQAAARQAGKKSGRLSGRQHRQNAT